MSAWSCLNFSCKKCNDDGISQIVTDIESIKERLIQINSADRLLDSEYNEELDDWYNSDVDEVLFSAPKGILKDINEAMELIHTCVDRELYKDGYGLSEILSVLEVSSEGDYCDYDGAPLYMCGLDQYNLLGHEYIPFVKECLYLAYLELNEVQLSKRTGIRAGILKIVSKKGKGMTVQKG